MKINLIKLGQLADRLCEIYYKEKPYFAGGKALPHYCPYYSECGCTWKIKE